MAVAVAVMMGGGWRAPAGPPVSMGAMSREPNDADTRTGADALRCLASEFAQARQLAERAVEQMPAADLGWLPDERSNSVAMLMKHVGGNLRSRFTDFLTTDGEKPDRDRDAEFRNDVVDKEAVLAAWRAGWECLEARPRQPHPRRPGPRSHHPRRAAHRPAGAAAGGQSLLLPQRPDRGVGAHAHHGLDHAEPSPHHPAVTRGATA